MGNWKPNLALLPYKIAILALLLALVVAALSCTTTKHIVSQKATIDSTAVIEKSDSIRMLLMENETLTKQVEEMQYGVVRFDTVFVPGDTVVNTVRIRGYNSVNIKLGYSTIAFGHLGSC